jgi:hypothetical protein
VFAPDTRCPDAKNTSVFVGRIRSRLRRKRPSSAGSTTSKKPGELVSPGFFAVESLAPRREGDELAAWHRVDDGPIHWLKLLR